MRFGTRPHPYLLVSLGWLILTGVLSLLGLRLAVKEAEIRFVAEANAVHNSLRERVRINEAVLEGFAALFRVIPQRRYEAAREYARQMRERYPHVYMLEAQLRVPRGELNAVEEAIRSTGISAFRVRNFTYDSGRQWAPVADKPLYYPIVFMEPMTMESRGVLGLDIDSVPHLRSALNRALESGLPAASAPFELVEGGRAYVLFHSVQPRDTSATPELVVSLVILTTELLKGGHRPSPGLSFTLYAPSSSGATPTPVAHLPGRPAASTLENWLLPRFGHELSVDSMSQPFTLVVEQQVRWGLIDLRAVLGLLFLAAVGYVGLMLSVSARLKLELARGEAYVRVEEQRSLLERRVDERTSELSALNERLVAEVEERRTVEQTLRNRMQENRRLLRLLIGLQEEERRALARELHDEIGQCLAAIKTEIVLGRDGAGSREAMSQCGDNVLQLTTRIYDSVHGIMRRLRPASLDDLGLEEALRDCVRSSRLEVLGVAQTQEFTGEFDDLSEAINITLYRVLQEALTNVVKHAGARRVHIAMARESGQDGHVDLSVTDDGKGMDLSQTRWGFGLLGSRERVQALGGRFEVESRRGEGVSIRVRLPVGGRGEGG